MRRQPIQHELYQVSPERQAHWLTRVRRSILFALLLITVSLGIGILGYHILGGFSWVDSFLEASMILGGMGPIGELKTDSVKIFAAIYALFSGLMLISTTGLLFAPWIQKIMYHTHRQAHCDAMSEKKQ